MLNLASNDLLIIVELSNGDIRKTRGMFLDHCNNNGLCITMNYVAIYEDLASTLP